VQTYFRIEPGDRDPERLLDPDRQYTEPWSGTVRGRCDKCGGSGETTHECESCRSSGPDPGCPVCHGETRYRDTCPACEGEGEIDDSRREGVSVFPDVDGLYRYMLRHDADLDGCQVVELAGEESEDEDFDADEGALLIRPRRVVASRPVDPERVEQARRELQDA
jgi:DnaJ-class molecular chaperone